MSDPIRQKKEPDATPAWCGKPMEIRYHPSMLCKPKVTSYHIRRVCCFRSNQNAWVSGALISWWITAGCSAIYDAYRFTARCTGNTVIVTVNEPSFYREKMEEVIARQRSCPDGSRLPRWTGQSRLSRIEATGGVAVKSHAATRGTRPGRTFTCAEIAGVSIHRILFACRCLTMAVKSVTCPSRFRSCFSARCCEPSPSLEGNG